MAIEGEDRAGAAGGGEGADGAAAAAAAAAGGGEGGGGAAGAGGESGGAPGAEGGDGGAGDDGKPWFDGLSGDNGSSSSLSDADWMKNKGYADLPTMVKAMRGLESKLATKGGGLEVPGEDATPEQIAAYHKAIGVPEGADGYEVQIPDGFEADMAIIDPLRAIAKDAGIPKPAFETLAKGFIDAELDRINAEIAAADQGRDAKYAEWGAQKDQNLALFQRGMKAFGLDAASAAKMQQVVGADKVLDMGLLMGRVSGEDGFIPGTPKSFAIDPSSARNELKSLESDPAFRAKLLSGDTAAKARHERLIAVISADDARKAAEDRVS